MGRAGVADPDTVGSGDYGYPKEELDGERLDSHGVSGRGLDQRSEGQGQFGETHSTKDAAVEAGRARAQQDATEHVIHDQGGQISERNSYGSDPRSSAG